MDDAEILSLLSPEPATIDIQLTEPQHRFVSSDAKYRAFISGIGAGKTVAGIFACLREAFEQPGSTGLIVLPTYTLQSDVLVPELSRWLPADLIREFKAHAATYELFNGSVIRLRSAADPTAVERLRGSTLAYCWIDECALVSEATYKILLGRLRQPGYRHRLFLTSTPKGFSNWLYKFVKDPPADSLILTGIPTESNVFLPDTYLASLREEYTGQFAVQELEGQFIRFEGLVYHVTPDLIISADAAPDSFDEYVYGVDFGFTNPSAVVCIGRAEDTYYILDEFYATRVTDDELLAQIKRMQQRYGEGRLFCDPSSPASIEKFQRASLPAQKADNDVAAGLRSVASLFSSRKLYVLDRCVNLVNELGMYSYNEGTDKPVKLFDHALDSLRYAVMGVQHGGGSVVNLGGLAEAFSNRTPEDEKRAKYRQQYYAGLIHAAGR